MNAREVIGAALYELPEEPDCAVMADAILAALHAAGLVVVPVEPTKAMRWAGEVAWEGCPPWGDQPGAVADPTPPGMMALCAIRYTIGRQSYVVSYGQQWALNSPSVRNAVIRDLEEAGLRCDNGYPSLGDKFDEAGWRHVLAELIKMKEAENDRSL